jgi:hypothetical protein
LALIAPVATLSGEQGAVAAPAVFVRLAGQRPTVRQLEVALGALERLDRRLLIDREHDRVLGRCQVQADDVGRLGRELGVGRETPGLAPGEVDPLAAQEPPDVLIADVAQGGREQRRGPTGEARGRRPVERGQDAPVDRRVIGLGLARARRIGEPGEPVFGEPHPPLADHAARTAELARDRPTRQPGRRQQHHPGALDQAPFGLTRADPALQRGPLLRRQDDRRRLLNRHAKALTWLADLC